MIEWIGWTTVFAAAVQLVLVPVNGIVTSIEDDSDITRDYCNDFRIAVGIVTGVLWLIASAGFWISGTGVRIC